MTILSLPWCYLGGVGRAPLEESGELRPPLGRDRRPDDSCRVVLVTVLVLSRNGMLRHTRYNYCTMYTYSMKKYGLAALVVDSIPFCDDLTIAAIHATYCSLPVQFTVYW
eukprot:scaffold237749_cov33-Attheya_sp.AAC.1